MFKVTIHKGLDERSFFQQVVTVETLTEAEILAIGLAQKHFGSHNIVLVHRGDLIYDIYKVFEPIGTIRIKTTGGRINGKVG